MKTKAENPFKRKRGPRKTQEQKREYDPNFPAVQAIWEALDKQITGEKAKPREESLLWSRVTEMYRSKVEIWDLVAEIVNLIDNPLIQGTVISTLNETELARRLNLIFDIVWTEMKPRKDSMGKAPNFGSVEQRVEIKADLLKLWYGCVGSAKIVAKETMSGINTKEDRSGGMKHLNWMADEDGTGCVALGIGAGPFFRHRRGQSVSYSGISRKQLRNLPTRDQFYKFVDR